MADRRRSVAAWLLLRQMLAERGLDADPLTIAENEFGKPDFDSALGVHFSLSHAGDRVMVAVSDAEVGCDVERIVPVDDGMLNMALAETERASLAVLSGAARDRAFIRLWVRKESYAKAIGRGLDIGLSTFSALDMPPSSGWIWHDFDFGDGHIGCACALCSEKYGKTQRRGLSPSFGFHRVSQNFPKFVPEALESCLRCCLPLAPFAHRAAEAALE